MVPLLLLSTALLFADVAVPHGAAPATAAPAPDAAERRLAAYRKLFIALTPGGRVVPCAFSAGKPISAKS